MTTEQVVNYAESHCPSCGHPQPPCQHLLGAKVCSHGDPTCPCPDGLSCHYEGEDAWPCPHEAKAELADEAVDHLRDTNGEMCDFSRDVALKIIARYDRLTATQPPWRRDLQAKAQLADAQAEWIKAARHLYGCAWSEPDAPDSAACDCGRDTLLDLCREQLATGGGAK